MRYFVTGGTGFLGGHLVDQLLEGGHEVVALARRPDEATDLEGVGAKVVAGDITEKETMRDSMEGVDGVFHLAGWYRVGAADPSPAWAINVEGTRNVLELVDELRVERAVYTSTLAVNSDTGGRVVDESYRFDGEHLTVYDRTKWVAHHEVAVPMADDGVPVVIAMPGAIYGPGDGSDLAGVWRDYLRGDLPAIPREAAYCWGHVEDTARALVLAMEEGEPGEEYVIAGEPRTLVEAFEIAERITGIDAPRALPPWLFRGGAVVSGVLDRFLTLPHDYRPESLRTLGGVTYLGDNAKARRELGIEHRSFEEGLREFLEHEMAEMGIRR